MGTRNLTMVYLDGEFKVSQYGQWDGNPGGQGASALNFLLNTFDRETFISKVKALVKPDQKRIDEINADENWYKTYPHLSRDMGAKILECIQKSDKGLEHLPRIDFAADSLMCEFVYVLDLDKNTFEIYRGFNKRPLTKKDRFFFLISKSPGNPSHRSKEDQYYPVKLMRAYSLKKLPTVDQMILECDKEGEATEIIREIHEANIVPINPDDVGDSPNRYLNQFMRKHRKDLPVLMGLSEALDKRIEEILKE